MREVGATAWGQGGDKVGTRWGQGPPRRSPEMGSTPNLMNSGDLRERTDGWALLGNRAKGL